MLRCIAPHTSWSFPAWRTRRCPRPTSRIPLPRLGAALGDLALCLPLLPALPAAEFRCTLYARSVPLGSKQINGVVFFPVPVPEPELPVNLSLEKPPPAYPPPTPVSVPSCVWWVPGPPTPALTLHPQRMTHYGILSSRGQAGRQAGISSLCSAYTAGGPAACSGLRVLPRVESGRHRRGHPAQGDVVVGVHLLAVQGGPHPALAAPQQADRLCQGLGAARPPCPLHAAPPPPHPAAAPPQPPASPAGPWEMYSPAQNTTDSSE